MLSILKELSEHTSSEWFKMALPTMGIWQYLAQLQMNLPFDLVSPPLGFYFTDTLETILDDVCVKLVTKHNV